MSLKLWAKKSLIVIVNKEEVMELKGLREMMKKIGFLWFEGFREACCLHRVIILSLRSKMLLLRTGQCFLLNGFIFLGSIFLLNTLIIPALWWILPHSSTFYSFLRLSLIHLFYLLWFYPLYVFSIVLSTIWYNDIAKYGYAAMGTSNITAHKGETQNHPPTLQNEHHVKRPSGLGGVMIGIGEQVYSILLLSVFFLEVYATGFIPYIGKVLNFVLLSWMYAYYCFEYKWNFNEVALDKRLDYFESYWAFFAGFGSPCVLAIFFFSPLVSYGIMAILFPLFVLTATGSKAEQEISFEKDKRRDAGMERLPIFYVANKVSMWLLSLLPQDKWDQMQDRKAQ
ncbi:PREDICTED: protein EI24 homolog isoform X1 [Lupinus angustifolius]|uniref:protein EI24 homolog isoform X1 n=1 Tax=Lupinus angustifolius TaxID=3871 RepID=UPI00092EE75B|nr:PREDICTED: protein EI24 homolog isoform X1 [Lupinus angustifolius]